MKIQPMRINLNIKVVLLVIVILVIARVLFWGFELNLEGQNQKVCLERKQSQVSGRIVSYYRDKSNKDEFTMRLDQGALLTTYVNYAINRPEKYIELGDSLYKPKGEFRYFIYKMKYPDSVILIDRSDIDCYKSIR